MTPTPVMSIEFRTKVEHRVITSGTRMQSRIKGKHSEDFIAENPCRDLRKAMAQRLAQEAQEAQEAAELEKKDGEESRERKSGPSGSGRTKKSAVPAEKGPAEL